MWFSSVQWLSCAQLFVTPWTAVHQAFLSITNTWSLLKLMSIESVMPSNHLILCSPLLLLHSIFLSIRSFQMSQFITSGGQSMRVSASASVLPRNTQNWSHLGWTFIYLPGGKWIPSEWPLSCIFFSTPSPKSSIDTFPDWTMSVQPLIPNYFILMWFVSFL